jgi:hypothetical protein
MVAGPLKFEPLIKYFTHVLGEHPVHIEEVASTTSAVPVATQKASKAKDAEAKRREMEAKWQEEVGEAEVDTGYSARTPLEEEAEEFEHGMHAAVELDGHARDEL